MSYILVVLHFKLLNLFNVFHIRALYYTKTLITNKTHKESFIINCNTLLHVSTLLGHLQGELFCYRYTKVALYSYDKTLFVHFVGD
jgi:hypothetical protein